MVMVRNARYKGPFAPTWPWAGLTVALALVVAPSAAGVPSEVPAASAASETTAPRGSAPEESNEAAGESGEGDHERDWLVDDQGKRYYTLELPKYEGHYVWVDENRVRIRGGLIFDVVSHDEDSFTVKIYERSERQTRSPSAAEGEGEDRVEEVAAPTVDRLRFERFDEGLPDRGQWRNGFDVADVNGDGELDLVHGPSRKGPSRPVIFLGDGKGRWRLWEDADFRGAPLDYGDAAVADFNGDGELDIAFASHLRGIKVFIGDGAGGFTEWSSGLPFRVPGSGQGPAEFSSRVVEVLDWNLDGLPDLVTLGEGPRMGRSPESASPRFYGEASGPVVFLNRGDGSWQRIVKAVGEGQRVHYGDTLSIADFNRDGRPDFAVGTAARGKRDLIHFHTSGPDGPWRAPVLDELSGGAAGFRVVTAGDFDGDEKPDLAVGYSLFQAGSWVNAVDVLLARPDGRWERQTVMKQATEQDPEHVSDVGIWALASGDLDGDGTLDLVAFDGAGVVRTYLGTGDGAFVEEESPELAGPDVGCRSYDARIRDLDGDGRGELLTGFAGEPGSEILLNHSPVCPTGGAFRVWTTVPVAPES